MASEHDTQLDALERVLGKHCPWAPERRVRAAAQVFENRMAEEDVEKQAVFTFEMLTNAQKLGRALAAALGPAPSTPGTPVLPPGILSPLSPGIAVQAQDFGLGGYVVGGGSMLFPGVRNLEGPHSTQPSDTWFGLES